MVFQGFAGGSASERVPTINKERAINFYPAVLDSGTPKVQVYDAHCPCIRPFVVLNAGPVRALFYEDLRCFAVGGGTFFEVLGSQTYVPYGSVAVDSYAATISTNGTAGHQLFVTSGGHGYIFDLLANTLTEIADPDFLRPTAMGVFVDGYFVSLVRGSRTFQLSDLEDGTSWSGLDVAQVSQSSDNIIAMNIHRRELWFQGSKTTSIWADIGAADFPFAPIPGAMLWQGTLGETCTAQLDDSLFWVGQNENGARVIYRTDGYSPKRISTHGIEYYLSQAARTDDILTYTYQDEGHAFFYVLVPTLETSIVYDVAGPDRAKWHERGDWDERFGKWTPHLSRCHAFAFGKHLVGDRKSPAIYEMSLDFATDRIVQLT